jgi:hypothetical protein
VDLELAAQEGASVRKAPDDLTVALADMKKHIAALEAQPLLAKGAQRSVPKTVDSAADAAVKAAGPRAAQERALALTKLSLRQPGAACF